MGMPGPGGYRFQASARDPGPILTMVTVIPRGWVVQLPFFPDNGGANLRMTMFEFRCASVTDLGEAWFWSFIFRPSVSFLP